MAGMISGNGSVCGEHQLGHGPRSPRLMSLTASPGT
jgi:hypothetical protein